MALSLKTPSPARGALWVREGFRLFGRKPLAFSGMFAAFLFVALLVAFVPLVGGLLQMMLLEPSLAILDETDSGLDIDALQVVANGVNSLRSPERSFVIVTHYQRLLDYIVPDFVHVLAHGRIVKSGGKELALELEEKGYAWIEKEVA